MPLFTDPDFDAPTIVEENAADNTDVYLYVAEGGGDEAAAADAALYDLLYGEDVQTTGDAGAPDFDAEDSFAFLLGNVTDGAAIPDPSTPAPPKTPPAPPEYGWEWEMENIGGARHTATGAMLQRILIYG